MLNPKSKILKFLQASTALTMVLVMVIVQFLLGQTPTKIGVDKINGAEMTANRDTSTSLSTNDNSHYPTTAAVIAYVAAHGGTGSASYAFWSVINSVFSPATSTCAGNGSTDDTTCLTNAINSVISGSGSARAGGLLVIQPGTYKITSTISAISDVRGLQFRGAGNGLVKFIWAGPNNQPMFWLKNAHEVSMSDFSVSLSSTAPLEEVIMQANYNQENGSIDPGHNAFERIAIQAGVQGNLQACFVKPETTLYGTVSVTNGSTQVDWVSGGHFSTASGTDWRNMVGKQFRIGPWPTSYTVYTVVSVTNNSRLVITPAYAGSNNSNIAYSAPPYDGNNDFTLFSQNVCSNYSGTMFAQGHGQAHDDVMFNNQCYPYGGKACVAGSIDGTVGVHVGFEWFQGGSFFASAADFRVNDSQIPIYISGLSSEGSRALIDSTTPSNGTVLPVTIENVRWAAGAFVDSSCNQASGLTNNIAVNYYFPGPFVLRNSAFYGCLASGGTYNVPIQFHWSFVNGQSRPSFRVEDVVVQGSSTSYSTLFINDGASNSAVPTNASNFSVQNSSTSYTNFDISRTTTNPHICTGNCSIATNDDVVLANCSAPCSVVLPRYDFYGVELGGAVGKRVVIQDISGNASTNNITITRDSSDTTSPSITIGGQATRVITTNYGSAEIIFLPTSITASKVGLISLR